MKNIINGIILSSFKSTLIGFETTCLIYKFDLFLSKGKLKRVKRTVKRSLKRIKRMKGGSWHAQAEAAAAAAAAAQKTFNPSHIFVQVPDSSAGSHNVKLKCKKPNCDAHYGAAGSEGTDKPCPWKKPAQVAPKVNGNQMIHATLDDSNFIKDFETNGSGRIHATKNQIVIGDQYSSSDNIICKKCKIIAWNRAAINRQPCDPAINLSRSPPD
jgi:hypothetical protein